MKRRTWSTFFAIVLLAGLLAGCSVLAAPAPVQAPATAAPPTAVPATEAPPTAVPPTEAPAATPAAAEPAKLILATTTSTADSALLDFILPVFESANNAKVDVVAVGTGQALEIGSKGDADVVLVHSCKGEDQFVKDGHAKHRFDVMYNDYVVVGPKDDPARVAGLTTGKDAFKAVMDARAPFVSRGDKSGTNSRELSIWSSLAVTPTKEMPWYNAIGQGMGDTLLFANEKQGYTLADRGTYLAMQDKLPDLAVLVGGNNLAENKDSALLNPYGVLAVNPELHPNVKADLADRFVAWLLSAETQKTIGGFGTDRFGQPLFYPNSEEYRAARELTVTSGN